MKTSEFNKIYKKAKILNIYNDSFFNMAGFFWINLTDNQLKKMYELLLLQGNKEKTFVNGKIGIELKNGLILYK